MMRYDLNIELNEIIFEWQMIYDQALMCHNDGS